MTWAKFGKIITIRVGDTPSYANFQVREKVDAEANVEDIPLPPPAKTKKSKFGLKEVTLDPSESSSDVNESDVKKAFGGFKRKANRGNMRQRSDD